MWGLCSLRDFSCHCGYRGHNWSLWWAAGTGPAANDPSFQCELLLQRFWFWWDTSADTEAMEHILSQGLLLCILNSFYYTHLILIKRSRSETLHWWTFLKSHLRLLWWGLWSQSREDDSEEDCEVRGVKCPVSVCPQQPLITVTTHILYLNRMFLETFQT